jgi:PDZ domain-containing protein
MGWLRRWWPALAPPVAIGLAALVCWFVNTNDFLVMPGEAVDTSKMVSIASAPPKSRSGQLLLVTVYSSPANLDEWLFGKVWPHARLLPAQTQLPPNTTYERFRHLEEAMMTDSQTVAKVVAMRELGYTVVQHGEGAVVDQVQRGSGADRAGIGKGDLIVAIDGTPIQTDQQLIDLIGQLPPGRQISVTIKPNNSETQKTVEATLGARPGEPDKPLLGITPVTYHPTWDFPVKVNIDSQGIIGPSAGLVLTLSIMQGLSPTDVTHGHNVAATGTIDINGNVGPIGDAGDKVLAATGHADYFFVPKANLEEAQSQASSRIKVVEIDSIEQAKSFLDGLASRK